MKRTREFYAVLNSIEMGIRLDYENLSICDLGYYTNCRKMLQRRFQVDYNGHFRFSQVYTKPEAAVDKFLGILTRIKEREILSAKTETGDN